MPNVYVDGVGSITFPDTMSLADIQEVLVKNFPKPINSVSEQKEPVSAKKPEDEGFFRGIYESGKQGIESFKDIASGYGLGASKLFDSPEETKKKMDVIKAEAAKPNDFNQLSFADLERIKKDEGLLSALGQVPKYAAEALAGSAPQSAVPLAVGSAATALALPITGPFAPVVGVIAGMGAYGLQQLGSNLNVQGRVRERPEDIDVGKAATASAIQAPLGYLADKFTLGLGGMGSKGVIAIGTELAARKAAGELGALGVARGVASQAVKGASQGFIAEAPTEALEQVLERWQAGQPLLDDEAKQAYKEAFFSAGASGGLGGAASRGIQTYSEFKQPVEDVPANVPVIKTPEATNLPSKEEQIQHEVAQDTHINPFGNVHHEELNPDLTDIIHQDRELNNKPHLKSYSLEDIADALLQTNEPNTHLDDILTKKISDLTQEAPEIVEQKASLQTPDAVTELATSKGIDTASQGYNDFLERSTGATDLSAMSPMQLHAAHTAISQVTNPELPEGTNAKRFTNDQYQAAISTLPPQTEITNVIPHIVSIGVSLPEAKAIEAHAFKMGDLEVEGNTVSPAGVSSVFGERPNIRYQPFKQSTVPTAFEVNGKTYNTEAEALQEQQFLEKARLSELALAKKGISSAEKEIARHVAEKEKQDVALATLRLNGKDVGHPQYDLYKKAIADVVHKKADDYITPLQAQLELHQANLDRHQNPVEITPSGEQPVYQDRHVIYGQDEQGVEVPVASFDTRQEAERHVINQQNKDTLQELIDSTDTGSQVERLKQYAQARIQELQGEAPTGGFTPEAQAKVDAIQKTLIPQLQKFGLNNVGVRIVNAINNGTADGEYVNKLINIAYDAENPMGTLRHETIHALKDLGAFTDKEWAILKQKAQDEWIQTYIVDENLFEAYQNAHLKQVGSMKGFEEMIEEEAIAEAFKHFAVGKKPSGIIGNIFNRISKLFEAIRRAFTGQGFNSPDKIFQGIEEGKYAGRTEGQVLQPKFSFKQENKTLPELTAEQRETGLAKFLEPSKVTQRLYHGTTNDVKSFDSTNAGKKTGNLTTSFGTFLSDNPAEASRYAEQWGTKGGNVMPVFAQVKNPYQMPYKEFNNFAMGAWNRRMKDPNYDPKAIVKVGDMAAQRRAAEAVEKHEADALQDVINRRDELIKMGHDGIIVNIGGNREVIVFDPKTIKSAIGNRGTYDITNPDIRYSLRAPTTPEFKRWFGKSKIVDEDGNPKVMYHGTARDITEFKPKQANAIFLTDKPDFAKTFAETSDTHIVYEKFKELPLTVKEKVMKQALKLAKQNGIIDVANAKFAMQTALTDGNLSKYGIDWQLRKFMEPYLDTGENTMPVFVRAEKPFDFAQYDEDSLNALLNNSPEVIGKYQNKLDKYTLSLIANGSWEQIEKTDVQNRLKDLKFDSFYVKEKNVKNLAVYKSSQIKSAIGNVGTYDETNPDIRYALRKKLPPVPINNAPPKILTKLKPAPTISGNINKAVNEVSSRWNDDSFFTRLRIAWVDPNASLSKSLQGKGVWDFGQLRADMLNRARSQIINLVNNGLQMGKPKLNNDGSIIIERSDDNLAISMTLADELDKNQHVIDSKLSSGRAYVQEVARALRGEEIQQQDAVRRAQAATDLAQASQLLKLAKSAPTLKEKNRLFREAKELREKANKDKNLNRELQVDAKQIAWAKKQLTNVPELNKIFGIWTNVNNSLITLWEDVGLLNEKDANFYRSQKSYVPLFAAEEDVALLGGEDFKFSGPMGAKSVKELKSLKGSELTRNIWENMSKNYAVKLSAAYENQTRKIAIEQLTSLGAANIATKPYKQINDINLRYKDWSNPLADKSGVVHAIVANPNDVLAFQNMHYELSPLTKAMSKFTNVLRTGALLNPMFWVRQLIRDPIHSMIVTDSGIVTPFHSAKEFISILRKESREFQILFERGVVGPVDSTLDFNDFLSQVGEEKTDTSRLKKAIHKIQGYHEASDAATRISIFKDAEKKALKNGMTPEDAINYATFKARESINFSVHGNGAMLNNLRHMIPFFSASITSLDTVYRAMTGHNLPPAEKAAAKKLFFQRAGIMVLSSFIYAAMMQGDDEYKDQPDYIKDNNWLIHSPFGVGFIKIPVPFEVGFFFKTMPEAATRLMAGTSTGKEVLASLQAGILQNIPGNGIPVAQAIKPIAEVIVNRSLYRHAPIETMADEGLPTFMRGSDKASEVSNILSKFGLDKIGLSPVDIDYLIQGYFAELGTSTITAADYFINKVEGNVTPESNLEKLPFAKAFLTDPNLSKAVNDFYEISHNSKQVADAFNNMKNHGKVDDAIAYFDKHEMEYALHSPMEKLGKQMAKIKGAINLVKSDESMTASEKRIQINELTSYFNDIARNGVEIAKELNP